MSLEKGISRVGTVIGATVGLIFSFSAFFAVYDWFYRNNRWTAEAERFSETFIILTSLAIGILGFLAVFFAIKGAFKIINWIIKGFKE